MKNGRNTAGQFTEGNSGRPKGSRNKATIAIERVLSNKVYSDGVMFERLVEAISNINWKNI